jgi:hypothetical protein
MSNNIKQGARTTKGTTSQHSRQVFEQAKGVVHQVRRTRSNNIEHIKHVEQ